MSSKLNGDLLREYITDMMEKSKGKDRKFVETIELQMDVSNP